MTISTSYSFHCLGVFGDIEVVTQCGPEAEMYRRINLTAVQLWTLRKQWMASSPLNPWFIEFNFLAAHNLYSFTLLEQINMSFAQYLYQFSGTKCIWFRFTNTYLLSGSHQAGLNIVLNGLSTSPLVWNARSASCPARIILTARRIMNHVESLFLFHLQQLLAEWLTVPQSHGELSE